MTPRMKFVLAVLALSTGIAVVEIIVASRRHGEDENPGDGGAESRLRVIEGGKK